MSLQRKSQQIFFVSAEIHRFIVRLEKTQDRLHGVAEEREGNGQQYMHSGGATGIR